MTTSRNVRAEVGDLVAIATRRLPCGDPTARYFVCEVTECDSIGYVTAAVRGDGKLVSPKEGIERRVLPARHLAVRPLLIARSARKSLDLSATRTLIAQHLNAAGKRSMKYMQRKNDAR